MGAWIISAAFHNLEQTLLKSRNLSIVRQGMIKNSSGENSTNFEKNNNNSKLEDFCHFCFVELFKKQTN